MPQETKLLFALSDISAMRFVCQTQGCQAVKSFPLAGWHRIPRTCSNDPMHDWLKSASLEEKMISELKQALQTLIKYNGTAAFKIQVEFNVPKEDA